MSLVLNRSWFKLSYKNYWWWTTEQDTLPLEIPMNKIRYNKDIMTLLNMSVIFSKKCFCLMKEQVNLGKFTQWMSRWPCFIVLMVSWSKWWWLNCPNVSTLCLCLFLIHSHNRLSSLSGHSDKSTRAGRSETSTMKPSVKLSRSTRQKLQWCFSSDLALCLHPSLSWWTVWSMRNTTHSSTGTAQAAAEPESWWMEWWRLPGSAHLEQMMINSLAVLLSVIYTVMQETMRNSCRSSQTWPQSMLFFYHNFRGMIEIWLNFKTFTRTQSHSFVFLLRKLQLSLRQGKENTRSV